MRLASDRPLRVAPEVEELHRRLREAEEALEAVLEGRVDSVRLPGQWDHRLLGRARAALDRVSNRYREATEQRDAVLDALPAQMLLLDAEGRIAATNRVWRRMADARGLAMPNHAMGASYLDVCAAADPAEEPEAPIVERGLRELLAGRREALELEYPCVDPLGRTTWYRLMASRLESGGGAVVLHLDVTSAKRAEQARVSSDRRWQRLVETLPDAFFLVDRQGTIQVANEAAAALLGAWPMPVLLGHPWRKLLHPDDVEVGLALLDPAEGPDSRPPVELCLLRQDGRPTEVEVTASTLGTESDASVLLIARDVARRKHAEREFRQLNDRYLQAQKLEAVGRLAGGVAHDFNNLLTAITGFGDLLRDQLGPGDPRRLHADEICKAGERAASLTRQLLTFGRRQPSRPETFAFDARLRDLENLLARTLGEDVSLRFDLAAPDLCVRADPHQVEQALVNLAVNARDAMPRGGLLEVASRPVGSTDGRPAEIVLTVRDEGEGIAPEVLPHVFEPFFTTKEGDKGTGLGLPMVYGVVQQAGGRVEVDSRPGEGTEVRLYWPTVPALEAVVPPPSTPADRAPSRTAVILVVEDEPAVRQLVSEVLEAEGHQLLLARDGHAAELRARQAPHLDLLLTDIILPGMNGREVAERILARHPEVPVLFMTGYSREELTSRTRREPHPNVLAKPFTPEELRRRVEEALARSRGQAGAEGERGTESAGTAAEAGP